MDDIVKITTDHQEIKNWAAKYQGKPEIIDTLGGGERMPGLRIDFPGPSDDRLLGENDELESVTWEEFFRQFDILDLAFEYEDRDSLEDPSSAYRFIKRANLEEEP